MRFVTQRVGHYFLFSFRVLACGLGFTFGGAAFSSDPLDWANIYLVHQTPRMFIAHAPLEATTTSQSATQPTIILHVVLVRASRTGVW